MEPDELEKVVKANAKPADFDRAALDRELARFRRQGYALTRRPARARPHGHRRSDLRHGRQGAATASR